MTAVVIVLVCAGIIVLIAVIVELAHNIGQIIDEYKEQ